MVLNSSFAAYCYNPSTSSLVIIVYLIITNYALHCNLMIIMTKYLSNNFKKDLLWLLYSEITVDTCLALLILDL